MGLLDEAIREHLELKRRRGGDPADIERAEREALGPVRRHPETADPAAFAEPAEFSEPSEFSDRAGFAEPRDFEEPADLEEPTDFHEPMEFHEPTDFDEPTRLEPPPTPHRAGGFEEEEEPLGPAAVDPDDQLGQQTVEYHVGFEDGESHGHVDPEPADRATEAAHEPARPAPDPHEPAPPGPAAEPHEEDVLEETPEFLQDAPEHDRLWFEQRPPRDFDFDG